MFNGMKSKSVKILTVGTVLVILMLLFPPWNYFDPDTSGKRSAGYGFILTPPERRPAGEVFPHPRFPHNVYVRLNDVRLILQLAMVVPAILGFALAFRAKRSWLTIGVATILFSFTLLVLCFVIWLMIS
jgi:hypothetical protein